MCTNTIGTIKFCSALVEFKVTGGSSSLQRVLSFTAGDQEHHMPFLELVVYRRGWGKLLLVKKESESQISPCCLCALTCLIGCVAANPLILRLLYTFEEHKGSVSSGCLFWVSYSVLFLSVMLEKRQSSGNQNKPDVELPASHRCCLLLTSVVLLEKRLWTSDSQSGCCVP